MTVASRAANGGRVVSGLNPEAGDGIAAPNGAWTFRGHTVDVFGEHVRRSIPMYDAGHELVCKLSDFFVRDDSLVYELGTSLGELMERLVEYRRDRGGGWKAIAIDVEPEMVQRARERLRGAGNVLVELGDVVSYEFDSADLIVSYYCLQFVPPKHRQHVLTRIYEALNWGGAFLWFEKVRGPDARFQDVMSALYLEHKLDQGYSCDEIVGKSRSLKGVLEPFSSEGNRDLLRRAGFVDVETVFRHVCFEGVLAIK